MRLGVTGRFRMPRYASVKKAAILILFCAAAVPAAVVAQTADAPPVESGTALIGTKWTLKPPKQAKPKMLGPTAPPAPRVRVRQSRAAQLAKRPPRKQRPNNTPIVNAIA